MDLHPGEQIIFEGHPSWRSTLVFYLGGLLLAAIAGFVAGLIDSTGLGVGIGVVVLAVVLVIGFLRRWGTTYVVTNERLNIRRGILARRTQETRLERVQNVNTEQGVLDRLLQIGTVDFDTAGTDDSDFTFAGVAQPEKVVQAVDRAQRNVGTTTATAQAPPTGGAPPTTGE